MMIVDPEFDAQHPLAGRGVYLLDDHEVVRRGLRQLLESGGLSVAGESGSALDAVRRIPALRPELVIIGDVLPDGSGAGVCRAIAAAAPDIRCVLMTGDAGEAVLIDAILAGAWGCLSKVDDSSEQLRLIRRALAGHTAYSARFRDVVVAPISPFEPQRPDEKLLTLTKQEMVVAIGVGRGLSNRQIAREMFLAEKTVKNMVSTILMKLGMARRTQAAVLIAKALNPSEDPADLGYRFGRFPDLISEVTAALLNCISESGTVPPTNEARARDAVRLADALAATRTGLKVTRPLPGQGR
ncbi:response regulator [Arthrobacter sp. 92]|uniref:response regulator n=1 Tax=Arthrobacter sp. 92 TaxID=3418175 RepID=UPI003D0596A7